MYTGQKLSFSLYVAQTQTRRVVIIQLQDHVQCHELRAVRPDPEAIKLF